MRKRIILIKLLLFAAVIVLLSLFQSDDTEPAQHSTMPIIPTQEILFASKGQTPVSITFPTVHGDNLEGREFLLPDDFEGALNLVFVAFQEKQQVMVNTWLPYARALSERDPRIRYYELPTIERLNPLFRWFINRGMRSGIPDSTARATTITLYIDKLPFREALDIPHEDTIYVFLVDDEGQALWRTEGVRTEARTAELQNAIESHNRMTNQVYNRYRSL